MKRLLLCELKKTKGRYYYAMLASALTIICLWAFHGNYNADGIRLGWFLQLYQFPLINAVFLPILSMITASMLCECEHRDDALRKLFVIADRGKIYDAKLMLGIVSLTVVIFIFWLITLIFGIYKGFEGALPFKLYIVYLVFTLIPVYEIYLLQHALALNFKNQAISFGVGIGGCFIGVFSMFLPGVPVLRQAIPYGHFGALDIVGMYGWSKETKMANVYFEVMRPSSSLIVIIPIIILVFYIGGKYIFIKKEV